MWWDEDHKLWLITLSEFNDIPDGYKLTCIDGEIVTKGENVIDDDTRCGCIAYGFTIDQAPLSYLKIFLDDKTRK